MAPKKTSKKKPLKFISVSSRSYGRSLKGVKIYFEGKKPKGLKKDGSIKFGKNILELLKKRFEKFQWILTTDENSIFLSYGIYRVRTSIKLLNGMNSLFYDKNRDIKNDIIRSTFSLHHPDFFKQEDRSIYIAGTLAKILNNDIISKLSSSDKDTLNTFLPGYIASESIASVNLLKAQAQIESLKELAENLKIAIDENHGEAWWQSYIKSNILIIQQGYIKAIEKMNTALGTTKYPDFSLVTHDNYLDILEIKKPSTTLVKLDPSRKNYYWDTEISKAVIQVENYIENITKNADSIRSYLKDTYEIELKILRPRGIILAGNSKECTNQKQKDDLRLLSQGIKNVSIVTYDELLSRLVNYIKVLEDFGTK